MNNIGSGTNYSLVQKQIKPPRSYLKSFVDTIAPANARIDREGFPPLLLLWNINGFYRHS